MELKGKVAVVTGGARGIGQAIVECFVREGARVAVVDRAPEGRALAERLGQACEFHCLDLRERDAIFSLAQALHERLGRIDILVNCAGIARPCPSFQLTEALLDEVIAINLKAPLYCCQAFGRWMKEDGGGSIVNISSGNSRMVNVGRTPYGITKAALDMLTRQLAAEWALYNIKVNAIAPGWIRTEMVETPLKKGILDEKKILSVSPIGRFGKVEEIAQLACFLASEKSDYMVGQIVFSDGGWSLGIMPDALDYIRENDS